MLKVEVSSFATDSLLENERNVRMSSLELLDEWEESFLDHLCIWIRERVEDESIDISVAKNLCKVRLHLAVTAAAKAKELDTSIS